MILPEGRGPTNTLIAQGFCLRLPHPLVELVPEPAVPRLRSLRKAFYGIRYSSATEAQERHPCLELSV